MLGAAEDEEVVVVAVSFGTGRVPPWPRPTTVSRDWDPCATVLRQSARRPPVLGAAEDEEAVVVTASFGTGRVPPGLGRPLCRETSSPRRSDAAVVGEAPPVLGAAEDEEAVVVAASLGTGRVPPRPRPTTVSLDEQPQAQRCGGSRRGAPRARRGGGRGRRGSHGELWNGLGTPLPRLATVSRD